MAPLVTGAERARQRRFMGLMIVGPFALLFAWPSVFAVHLPVETSLTALAAMFCLAWGLAAIVALRATIEPAAQVALVAAAAVLCVAVTGAGGLASPAALLLAAPAFEAWWVMRDRVALRWGAAVAAIAAIATLVLPFGSAPAAFAAWHWLLPAAYCALAMPRLAAAVREEMEISRQPRESALEDVIEAVVLRILPGGDVREAGGRTRDLIGVSPDMLLGEGFLERVHVADRVFLLRAIGGSGSDRSSFDLRVRVAGEPAGTFATFAADLYAGSPCLLTLRDNATVKALREELEQTRELAASSDIAKARFLAAVSHELRTPLNAIIGFSDMLAYEMVGKFSDPRQKEYATMIRDSGSHLLGVVNSILDVSKIESGAYPILPEPFAFADAASVCHAMLTAQAAEKSIHLVNGVTPASGDLCADRRAIQQILINLLSNAVKFTPNGGSVTLDASRTGRTFTFRVCDTGIGIEAQDLARLGRPFVQVQNDYTRQFDGAGLGLSIAKGLVSLHGGTMTIQSTPGAGTVVSVVLPVDAAGHLAAAPAAPVPQTEEDAHASFRKSA